MNCRHCSTRKATKARGLCPRCYYAPGVREQYPVSTSKYARRSPRADDDTAKPADAPSGPTGAIQGSEEKILEMQRRAARRESLHHPGDGPRDG
jgi:hypothetical protein